jgi:hypothetical protein
LTEPGPLDDSGASPPGIPDFGELLSRLGQVQQSIQDAQQTAAAEVFEGSAGGGAVRIQATGALEFQQVTIDPDVVDPSDVEMLQDLVLAAVRDVVEQVQQVAASALGGFDLGGGLGGLFGQ